MGFLDPKGNLADYQHASRLFVDDTFRLAPKNKFLYYVVFNINPDALTDVSFQDRHRLELNYLVKTAELPKYTIKTETLNQYNRKTNVYTSIAYDPITISLHDDNNGITNMLWALYYGYYFNDRNNSSDPYTDINPIAYGNTAYNDKSYSPFRYGLDTDNEGDVSGTLAPFFESIQLFTLSRQRFFSYLLCNPKITKWDHDALDYSEGSGVVENKMTLAYEAVIYNSGMVDVDDPTGFAVLHYDNTPSPIAGDEIIENGIAGIFGDVFSLNSFASPSSYITGGITNYSNPYLNMGNQMPYGYGTPDFYGSTMYSPYGIGGLQNYNFGGRPTLTGALIGAGIGLAGRFAGNILNNFNNKSGIEERTAAINEKYSGVATPGNGSAGATRAEQVKTLEATKSTAESKLLDTQNKLSDAQKAEQEATSKFNDSTAKAQAEDLKIKDAETKISNSNMQIEATQKSIDEINSKQASLDQKLANGEITLDEYNTKTSNNAAELKQEESILEFQTNYRDNAQKQLNESTILKSNYQNSADQAFENVTTARENVAKLDQQQINDAKALDAAEQAVAKGPPPIESNPNFRASENASMQSLDNYSKESNPPLNNNFRAAENESMADLRNIESSYRDPPVDEARSIDAAEQSYASQNRTSYSDQELADRQTQQDAAAYDAGGGSYADYSTTTSDQWEQTAYSRENVPDTPFE